MAKSMYQVKFQVNSKKTTLCKVELTQKDIEKLKSAIEDLYYFEFVVDDIQMRGFIGQLEEGNILPHKHVTYMYTHYDFHFEYNEDRVSGTLFFCVWASFWALVFIQFIGLVCFCVNSVVFFPP